MTWLTKACKYPYLEAWMPADTSTGLLPPFLPTAFPLNLCVSKACEALCLHHPCCPITIVCGHFSPLARLEQETCSEWKGAEALMQLRSCSTVVDTVGLNALFLNSKVGVFSFWLIFLSCVLLGSIQRHVHGLGQQYRALLSGCALTAATPGRDQSPH